MHGAHTHTPSWTDKKLLTKCFAKRISLFSVKNIANWINLTWPRILIHLTTKILLRMRMMQIIMAILNTISSWVSIGFVSLPRWIAQWCFYFALFEMVVTEKGNVFSGKSQLLFSLLEKQYFAKMGTINFPGKTPGWTQESSFGYSKDTWQITNKHYQNIKQISNQQECIVLFNLAFFVHTVNTRQLEIYLIPSTIDLKILLAILQQLKKLDVR